jgi:hypothetical protein
MGVPRLLHGSPILTGGKDSTRPLPTGWAFPLFAGSLFDLRRPGILGYWTDAWREHGDVVQVRMDPMMKRSGNGPYAELSQAVASATESTYGPGRGSDP